VKYNTGLSSVRIDSKFFRLPVICRNFSAFVIVIGLYMISCRLYPITFYLLTTAAAAAVSEGASGAARPHSEQTRRVRQMF